MAKYYKNFSLVKCFCGYPEKRYLIYFGITCKGSAKTLKEAKTKVNEILSNDPVLLEYVNNLKKTNF